MEKIYLTPEGYETLKAELEALQGPRRRDVIAAIQAAREHGDLSENAEYDAAKEEQAKLELRIHQLQDQLSKAQIIDRANIPAGKISVGQRVRIRDEDSGDECEYVMVAPAEADFDKGRISVTSPLGKGLVGRRVDEVVVIRIPAGVRRYTVLAVEPV